MFSTRTHRKATLGAIVIGSIFLGMGTCWQIGLGVAFLSWAGLPLQEVKK